MAMVTADYYYPNLESVTDILQYGYGKECGAVIW